jgi:hypothetical protein
VREVLDERLDATGGEFTTMRQRLRELGWLFVFLAGLRAFQAVLQIMAGTSLLILVDTAIFVGGMLSAAALVKQHPRKAMTVVAVVWGGLELLAALINPLSLVAGFIFKLITLGFIVRGFVAAKAVDRIRAELAKEADLAAKGEFRPA